MIIQGTAASETLTGTDGDDVITGLGGFDTIDGGAGNDTIDGGAGGDSISGGAGNDTIDGGEGNDSLSDYSGGSDTLRGGDGDDYLTISHFSAPTAIETIVLDGGAGNDKVTLNTVARGTVRIDLGDGADTLSLGASNAIVTAMLGAGQDRIVLQRYGIINTAVTFTDFSAGMNGDTIDVGDYLAGNASGWASANPFGAAGYLRLVQTGSDTLVQFDRDGAGNAIAGFTTLLTLNGVTLTQLTAANLGGYAPDGSAPEGQTITGTKASDILTGTPGDDIIAGLGGFDRIDGKAGNDRINGGDDSDSIDGGLGDDVLEGAAGDDYLSDMDGGSDTLRGGTGNDSLTVSHFGFGTLPETIAIDGGDGDDTVSFSSTGRTTLTVDLGSGADRLSIGSAFDSQATLSLGAGQDTVYLQRYSGLRGAVITDFAAGASGDAIDVADYLSSTTAGWDGTNPFGASGLLRLTRSGADTLLEMDHDGPQGVMSGFTTLFTFQNTAVEQFTAANFKGFAPDGSAVVGMTIVGTERSDTLIGTTGADIIAGLGGSDSIDGKGGDDRIDGGDGADLLEGGAGNDVVDGGDGDDYVADNGNGSDTIRGGGGSDTISVYHTNNNGMTRRTETVYIGAGSGNDQVSFSTVAQGSVTIDLGDGDDRLTLYGGADTNVRLVLGAGKDVVDIAGYPFFAKTASVADFAAGASGDILNLRNYLGGMSVNPFANGYLRLVQVGGDTLLQIDRDGATSNFSRFTTLMVLENTKAADFTAANFAGYAPVGFDGADIATAVITAPVTLREGDASYRLSMTLKNVTDVSTTVTMTFLADQSTAIAGTDATIGAFTGNFVLSQSVAGDYRIDLGSIAVIDDLLMEGGETVAVQITATGQTFDNGTDTKIVRIALASDDLIGSELVDTLTGTALADRIVGNGGNDTLYGNGGDDRLNGGRGNDAMWGGAGKDVFVFDTLARGEKDAIRDFGTSDRVYTTTKISDSNNDGIVTFGSDKRLDVGGGEVAIYSEAGKTVTALHFLGEVVEDGATFYAYGLLGQ
jgi:Ca2+-binding RTX toxin-like protein